MDSLLLNLSPIGRFVQVNIHGIGMFFVAVLLFVWIIKRISREKVVGGASLRWNSALLALVLVAQFFSFITWVVAPYTQVMIAKANTRFVAGNLFLADNRKCEASAMYLRALAGRTIYLTDAFTRIGELLPRAQGRGIAPSDLTANVQASEIAIIEEDDADALDGASSLKISLPAEKDEDVYVYTDPIGAKPNKPYELSGWIKVEGINDEKYAVVSIVEDDGNWGNSRGTTILSLRGTYGWQPFAQTITTLPTTRRVFLVAGLWRTHGTVWFGLLQFALITEDNPATKILRSCPP
jgi:type IV secretory pathway TrbD component